MFYRYYGGAGITVCDRWESFANFLEDMGEANDSLQIDRIDPTVGYEPGNCRWVTPSLQNANRRGWGKSGYKGVYRRPSGRFCAVLRVDGKTITLGTFDTEAEAAAAFDAAVTARFGEHAMTNKRMGFVS